MAANITETRFVGLIRNRPLNSLTTTEFWNAIKACGWQEGTGTHFFRELCKDGPTRGITTLAQLEREIARGYWAPGTADKTLHWICNGSA
jgi:hypothetical protein